MQFNDLAGLTNELDRCIDSRVDPEILHYQMAILSFGVDLVKQGRPTCCFGLTSCCAKKRQRGKNNHWKDSCRTSWKVTKDGRRSAPGLFVFLIPVLSAPSSLEVCKEKILFLMTAFLWKKQTSDYQKKLCRVWQC